MNLFQRLFRKEDEDLVSRPEFDEHVAAEGRERERVAARLLALEVGLANEGRLPRMPRSRERGR